MSRDSLFIVIEGLDGSGKTSVARQLANVLDYSFKGKVKLTFEPHDPSCAGLFIRQVLMKKIRDFSPWTLAQAFAVNRSDHCDREINPWLKSGNKQIIICDRYYLSSLVYQSSDELSFRDVFELSKKATKPDIIFFINVDNRVCYERMKIRNQPKELFEKNLSHTRKKYFEAIEFLKNENNDKIIEIDGSGTIKEVVEKMKEFLYDYKPDWKPSQPVIDDDLIASHVFSLNGRIDYTIDDVVKEIFQKHSLSNFDEIKLEDIQNLIDHEVDQMSFNRLGAIFLDYIRILGYKVEGKLPWTHLDCYELEFELPGNLLQRGTALLINETQRYDVILQGAPELFKMSDFMLVFSPGPSELVTKHYERDKIQFENKLNNEVAVSLFPSTQLVTRKDLANTIFKNAVSMLINKPQQSETN